MLIWSCVAVQTVEKVASSKVFFETHYNNLTSVETTPRSLRLRQLEEELYENTMLTGVEKEEKRHKFYRRETSHLRELRVMKGTRAQAEGKELAATKYEVIRVGETANTFYLHR